MSKYLGTVDLVNGLKVDAYRNLNKPPTTFTIRHKSKVIAYQQHVYLTNVVFKHPTAKALTRIREKHREVCMWIKGELQTGQSILTTPLRKLKCDPKHDDYFSDAETGERVNTAQFVYLSESGAYYEPGKFL